MGLLDGLSNMSGGDQMGLAIAQGLLSARGSAGMAAGLGNMQQVQDSLLKRQLLTEDIKLKQLSERRAQAMFDMQQEAFRGIGGGPSGSSGTPALPAVPGFGGGALGSGSFGVSSPGQPGQPASMPQTDMAAQLNRLERMAIAGVPGAKESLDIFKYKNDPQTFAPGSVNMNRLTGQMTTIPSVSQDGKASQVIPDPSAPGGFRVIAPQGALDTYSGYAEAGERAKNNNTLLPLGYVDSGTKRPIGGTIGNYLQGQPLQNQGGGALTPEMDAFIKADAARNGIPNPQVNFTGARPGASYGVQAAQPSIMRQPGGGLQSAAEAEAAKAEALAPITARTAPLNKYHELRAAAADSEEKDIGAQAAGAADFAKRINDMRDVMKFDPNAGTPMRKKMAETAQALGMPDNVVNGVAGGDLASIQTFQKMAITNAMEALKSDMNQGRITQGEFAVYKENQPNIGLVRQATENIFNRAQERNALALSKQQEYSKYKQSALEAGHVPDGFGSYWNQKLQNEGKVRTDATPMAAPGASGKPPVPMKGMVRNGYKFKGGEPSDPNSWEKQ